MFSLWEITITPLAGAINGAHVTGWSLRCRRGRKAVAEGLSGRSNRCRRREESLSRGERGTGGPLRAGYGIGGASA